MCIYVQEEASDPTAPSATLSATSLDFGKVDFGDTKDLTFTVTPANLTGDLTLSCSNSKYEVSPTSIASTETTAQTITVTAKPTALADNMSGTITISGGGLTTDKTVTLTTTVTDPNANDGSAEKPYTVAEALTLINALANNGTIANMYVKGVVCTTGTVSSKTITYYISDDGTETNRLQVYKGKGLNKADFTSNDDIQLGDKVVVSGTLKKYVSGSKTTPEFDSGNYLVSLTRKAVSSIALSGTYTTTFVEGSTFNHDGLVVTATYDDATTEDVTAQATFSTPDMTTLGTQTITVTYSGKTATYTITITEAPKHTATFSINGEISTEDFKEGAAITFPSVTAPAGYTFRGWTNKPIDGVRADAPAILVTEVTMGTGNADFYAVFAQGSVTSATATLTANSSWNGYADKTFTDDKGNTWTANCAGQNNSGTYVYGLNSTNGSYVESPQFAGNITSIKMYGWNGSSSATRTFYIKSTKEGTSGDLGSISVGPSEKSNNELTAVLTEEAVFSKFYLGVSAALSFHSISVTYEEGAYSNYCTTVPTATITISDKCTDDTNYFGTYYTDVAYVMPEGVTGQTVTVTNNTLTVTDAYAAGSVVPANTALLLKAETAGDKVVTLTTGGTAPAQNMLKGTLTADDVTEGENCLFYRLTMHNGKTIGFWWGAAEGAAFKPGAHKAYLAVPKTQAARLGFAFGEDGETTGIEGAAQEQTAGLYYDLQGRRVAQSAGDARSTGLKKGLYIVNGKKVIVK